MSLLASLGRSAAATVVVAALIGAAPAGAHLLYVSNEKDNTVSVVDTETGAVVDTIKVGKRPRGIVFSPDHSRFYLCASSSDTVQVWDVATKKLLHNLPSGQDPELFALSPDGRRLVISNEDDAIATIVDVETRKVEAQIPVGEEPEGVAITHDGKAAVVTSETTNMAHWIDLAAKKAVWDIPVDPRPRYAVFSADDSRLWVSSEIGGTVTVVDVAARKVVKTISFAIPGVPKDKIQPVGMRLTRDGRWAFVALGPADHVAVIDAKTFEVKKYILTGKRVWQMDLTPEEDRLWVTNGVSGDVTEIDVAGLVATRTIKVGRYPWGVAIRPTR
jgi:PQQ-dependent catabolism-associated beta-propeller protein